MNVEMAISTLREKAGQANELQRLRDRVAINHESGSGWYMTTENKKKLELLADWLRTGERSS